MAGLAREVEALRRAVHRLHSLPGQLDDLAAVVAQLTGDVARLTAAPGGTAPPSWLALGELDDAAATQARLIDWMHGVYLRFADGSRTLPGCWLWHPEVVEELLWLRAAWIAAHEPSATIAQVADWHDRHRPGVVRRIKDYAGLCSLENHQPGHSRHQPAPNVPVADAATAIAGWWSTGRDTTPPVPTAEQLAEAGGVARVGSSRGRP